MSKMQFKLNRGGVRELLRSEGMMNACKERAEVVRQRCGEGYGVSGHTGKNRVNVSVYAETKEARQDNLDNNTLEKMVRS